MTVSGVPEKRKGGTPRLIGKRVNNEISENNTWGDERGQLTTSEGYTSAGVYAANSRPRMASKWGKRTLGKSITELEEERKRAEVINDISQHCRALRENPGTWLC